MKLQELVCYMGGPYFVFGRPLMLKVMPGYIKFDANGISSMLVQIKLPGFPLDCWNPKVLSKIASKFGNPISTDMLTTTKDRSSYARVLVEIDASKELVCTMQLNLPIGKLRTQHVAYEYEPKFYGNMFGHTTAACSFKPRAGKQNQVEVQVGTQNQIAGDGLVNAKTAGHIVESSLPKSDVVEQHAVGRLPQAGSIGQLIGEIFYLAGINGQQQGTISDVHKGQHKALDDDQYTQVIHRKNVTSHGKRVGELLQLLYLIMLTISWLCQGQNVL